MTGRVQIVHIHVDRGIGMYEAAAVFASQRKVGVVDVLKSDDSIVKTWRYTGDSQDFDEIYDYLESNG